MISVMKKMSNRLPRKNIIASTRTNATPIVRGGVADVMNDLKNSPTRIRIRRIVKGSIFWMSLMAPVMVSWLIAGVPVRYAWTVPIPSEYVLMNSLSSFVSSETLSLGESPVISSESYMTPTIMTPGPVSEEVATTTNGPVDSLLSSFPVSTPSMSIV